MDEQRKMADEHTIGWIKYIDHNGEFPTEMVTCDPDDDGAIPICRLDQVISRETAMLDEFKKDNVIINKSCLYKTMDGINTKDEVFVYGKKYVPVGVLEEIEKPLKKAINVIILSPQGIMEQINIQSIAIKEALSIIQRRKGWK